MSVFSKGQKNVVLLSYHATSPQKNQARNNPNCDKHKAFQTDEIKLLFLKHSKLLKLAKVNRHLPTQPFINIKHPVLENSRF